MSVLLFWVVFAVTQVVAQQSTLRIIVDDATTGQPLPGARVVVTSARGTMEYFTGPEDRGLSLNLEPGSLSLQVSFIGFRKVQREAELSVGSSEIRVSLEPFRMVSIVQLLALPEKYDGLPIIVDGFCSVEFENNAIYLHQEDWKYALTSNALWLKSEPGGIARQHHLKHVTLFGVFNAKDHGHGGLFGGAIESIERVIPLQRRK